MEPIGAHFTFKNFTNIKMNAANITCVAISTPLPIALTIQKICFCNTCAMLYSNLITINTVYVVIFK